MALLPKRVFDNLNSQSFVDEFSKKKDEYIELAHLLAQSAISILARRGIVVFKSEEDFAEDSLVSVLSNALLSEYFPYFRQALKRRVYIDPSLYYVWARSMARYVLSKAIEKGRLL